MVEDSLQGKYFSITDPQDIKTVIYQVNKTEKEFAKNGPKYTVERLEYSEELIGANNKKTFFVNNPAPEGNPLVILSFAKEKVVVNMGFLDYDVVKISKKPMPMKFTTFSLAKERITSGFPSGEGFSKKNVFFLFVPTNSSEYSSLSTVYFGPFFANSFSVLFTW